VSSRKISKRRQAKLLAGRWWIQEPEAGIVWPSTEIKYEAPFTEPKNKPYCSNQY
jgi:hypothetical protein